MSYQLLLDGVRMPIMPGEIRVRYRGRNERISMIGGGEITQIRQGEHAQISINLSLPRRLYPFAHYPHGFIEPERFLNHFLELRDHRRPFRFICSRQTADGRLLSDTNLRVTIEALDVIESAEDGDDLQVQLNLREFRDFATRRIDENRMISRPVRETENLPFGGTHTVVRGDNLWNLARKFLGNGLRYREIFELNRDQIQNPNLIFPGQVLRLPPE